MAMQQVGSFPAVDNDGNKYTVNMYRKIIDNPDHASSVPTQTLGRLTELRTSDGRSVKRIDKGSYEIIGLLGNPTTRITSGDPNAP